MLEGALPGAGKPQKLRENSRHEVFSVLGNRTLVLLLGKGE